MCVLVSCFHFAFNKNNDLSNIFECQILKNESFKHSALMHCCRLFKQKKKNQKPRLILNHHGFFCSRHTKGHTVHVSGRQVMCLHASVCLASGSVTVAMAKGLEVSKHLCESGHHQGTVMDFHAGLSADERADILCCQRVGPGAPAWPAHGTQGRMSVLVNSSGWRSSKKHMHLGGGTFRPEGC